MESIEAKVRNILAEVTGLPQDIAPDADLYLDLGVASVHALKLLTQLEEQFNTTIPDDDFVMATSVTALVKLMSDLNSEQSARASQV